MLLESWGDDNGIISAVCFYPKRSTVSDTIDMLRDDLKARLAPGGYQKLADELDVSKGALWKFIKTDYIPTNDILRRKLGIPEPELIEQYRDSLTGRFT